MTHLPLTLTGLRNLFTEFGLFPRTPNVQVTSGTPRQARSESVIAVNPSNRNNLIAASKKFSNPNTYRNTIGIRVSFNGGEDWQDSVLPTLPEWGDMIGVGGNDPLAGMTDPAVVFDSFGNAFMVGEPVSYHPDLATEADVQTTGMYIYKSTDGGLTWSAPIPLHVGDKSDDKPWIACDNNPVSPHYGHVYMAWGASSPLRFARSVDHGASWKGKGNEAPASQLYFNTYAPEISVGLDGTIHIVWHTWDNTRRGPNGIIQYIRSTDGGETFEGPKTIVEDVWSLKGNLPEAGSLRDTNGNLVTWPHFPGAQFRVLTLATGCGFGSDPLASGFSPLFVSPTIVAWSDFREGAARIYYRTSTNAGASFLEGPPESGQPLIGNPWPDPNLHHFHPQIVCTGSGVIGCAYYEYTYKGENRPNLIDVKLKASFDKGKTFVETATITDRPWDPAVDAPRAHSDPQVTFIGEYFGLDADETGFDVLWTDTRTGVQELFYSRVETQRTNIPPIFREGIIAQILAGVIQGGGGVGLVNGHIFIVPPRGPVYDLTQAMAALDAASRISGPAGRALTKSVYRTIGAIAAAAGRSLEA